MLFDGPLFLSCFTNTADESQTTYASVLGPIEIEPVVVDECRDRAGMLGTGEMEPVP